MLKFFSTGLPSRNIAIFLLLVFFWIPAFLDPQSYHKESETLLASVFRLADLNIYFSLSIAFVIIVFSALMLNQLAIEFDFSSRYSNLGLFYFVIFTSALPAFFTFNPIIIANILALFLLRSLYKLPSSDLSIPISFNSGLLVGLTSLFFPPMVLLLLFLWTAIFIHHFSTWRNIIASVLGAIIPFLFLFTWYFWNGSVVENTKLLLENFLFKPQFSFQKFSFKILVFTVVMSLTMYAVISTLTHLREKNINLRRNLMITITYLLFSTALSACYARIPEAMLLVASPSALLLSNFTLQKNNLKWLNLVVYMLLILIAANLYLKLFFETI